jgi:hypothetical protein
MATLAPSKYNLFSRFSFSNVGYSSVAVHILPRIEPFKLYLNEVARDHHPELQRSLQ